MERLPALLERHELQAGHVASSLVLGRRRVPVSRPQVAQRRKSRTGLAGAGENSVAVTVVDRAIGSE